MLNFLCSNLFKYFSEHMNELLCCIFSVSLHSTERVPIVIFCAYFWTYFCVYCLLGGKDTAGNFIPAQKQPWAATKPLGPNPLILFQGVRTKPLTFPPGWRETSTPNKK